jgi:type IX secretion system PorP/SprF family membrane protein
MINPAFAGNNNKINAFIHSGRSLVDVDGAPKTVTFGIHSNIMNNTGIGTKVITDKRGVLESTAWVASYSYRFLLSGNDQSLTFGISGGLLKQNLNRSNIIADNMVDPTLNNDYYNETDFESEAGFLYRNKNFSLSVSAPHVHQFQNRFIAYTNYVFKISGADLKLIPNVLFQTLKNDEYQYDAGMSVNYKDMVWLSGKYRSNNNAIFAVGFDFRDIGLAYSYEMNNSNLAHVSKSNHELILFFKFGKPGFSKKEPAEQVRLPEKKNTTSATNPDGTEAELKKRIKLLEEQIKLQKENEKLKQQLDSLKKEADSFGKDL